MRSRLFNFLSCLLLSATAVQSAQAVDLTTQRQYYDQAKRALAKGDSGPYMQYSQALADYPLTLRMQPGYDHSYFFIASFIDDHLRHHATALGA